VDAAKLKRLLTEISAGAVTPDEGVEQLRSLPFEDLEHARLDLHRELRTGLPEVVFCEHKTAEQVLTIVERLWQSHDRVLATRISKEKAAAVRERVPEARYDPVARLLKLSRSDGSTPSTADDGASPAYALVVSGGTSDLPVAEEAAQTLEFFGSRVERAYDVGVAGVHRLLDHRDVIFGADVVISVAGMEGALTSVVGGLVACPVIGVPTSVGYGASFEGVAPLLTMLNSCATGVAVVNIDNGFGAGTFAHLILRRLRETAS